nr:ABC transporter permease [Anaeromonas gelatinilytica]
MLTIIGIILSVSLISSIGLFLKGMQEVQIEKAKNTYGSHHLQYTNPDKGLIEKISNNPKVARNGTFNVEEEFTINDSIDVREISATNQALELLPYQVKEGRFPEDEGEVALEGWLLRYIDSNADIGGKIEINNEEYRLVGILENNIMEQINNRGNILKKGNYSGEKETVLLVEISSKTNLKSAVKELSKLGEEDDFEKNEALLGVQGASERDNEAFLGLYIAVGVIILIVVISTIAVIYNSFQISVMERIKEFGLLRAVGTTPKQIRKIILREATLLSLIGIPIGLFFGIVAIYSISFAFKLIGGENLEVFKPVISPTILGCSAAIGLVSIYLSALMPSIFASKISPLVAISSRKSIKKEKIKRRKSLPVKITGKLLGFEGELAHKNIKRNRKRYRITVFSIIISVILFITFKSFVDMSLTVTDGLKESQNVHFSITRGVQGTSEGITIDEDVIKEIEDISSVKKVYKVYDGYEFNMEIDKNKEIKELQGFEQDIYRESSSNGKTEISGSINIYDKNVLDASKKYVKSGNIDTEELDEENGVILIRKNRIFNYDTNNTYYGPVADIKVGDKINVSERLYWDQDEEKADKLGEELKVVAIVEDEVFSYNGNPEGLRFITSKNVAKRFTKEESLSPINLNIVLKDIESEKMAIAKIENIIKENPDLEIINHIDNNRKNKSSILMIQILLYGFVVVVSLIGSVNIINTLTTNILLRKREFATLRSIGLTHKGLRKMIVLEGMLYGIKGIIYGSIIGSILSFILAGGINEAREFSWGIPWSTIGIAAIATLIIGYLSVLYPLARIKKDNLIETIKGDY